MSEIMIEANSSYIVFTFADNYFDNGPQFVENCFDFQIEMKHKDRAHKWIKVEQNIEQGLSLLSKTLNNKELDYFRMNILPHEALFHVFPIDSSTMTNDFEKIHLRIKAWEVKFQSNSIPNLVSSIPKQPILEYELPLEVVWVPPDTSFVIFATSQSSPFSQKEFVSLQ